MTDSDVKSDRYIRLFIEAFVLDLQQRNIRWAFTGSQALTGRKPLPEKKKIVSTCKHVIYQNYNIKYQKHVIFQIYSENHNIQYQKVKITNFILKGYPFNYTREQFQSRIYGCNVC